MSDAVAEQVVIEPTAQFHEQGLALARQGRFDEAIGLFQTVLNTDPQQTEAIRHLAQAYADAGRLAEAETQWGQYIQRCPESADAHRHLGNLRKRMDKLDLAIEALKTAASLDEKSPAIQIDLGIALAQVKRQPEAKQAFGRALELQGDSYDAMINLGMLLQEMGEGKEAMKHLRKAVEMRPDDPSGINNLGVALSEQGELTEAIACYEKLLAKTPDYVLAWNNMGNALRSAGRIQDAAAALEKALEIKPDYAEAHNNLGIIRSQLEDFEQAIRCYGRAMLLRPDYPEAHANRGLVYLLMGNFQQGWADYEWRWQGGHGLKRRSYPGKMWDGSPLAGKRILLYYEQGLGDTFQFIRYAKELKSRGATVIFECQPILRQILDRTPGIDEFVIRGEKPPACDFYAPLLSLPGLCQTNLDNLPRKVPYVFTDPAMVWEWKRRMAHLEGFRIGIVWQGNPEHKGDRYRSIALKAFAPLAKVPGVTLVTLQKGLGVEQIEKLDGLFGVTDFKGLGEEGDGFLRTAAIIANLDLVICADTSVAHLAGAMGVPVWVAIQTSPDWRWLMEREDTAWYPTMRLFRQSRAGDWDELLGRIAEALRQRLDVSGRTLREPTSDIDQQEAQTLLHKADGHINRNELLQALDLLERAVRLAPTNSNAQQDLGVTYAKLGRLREGIACFRRALEIAPDAPGVYSNLGLACYQAGLFDESVSHLRKAIWLGAGSPETHKNLALALTALANPAAAEECYWSALRLRPDDAEAHYRLSQVLLMQGKFEQGWLEYEWRWRWRSAPRRHLDRPRWAGQKLDGKRVVILAEHDTRDTLQFARYADVIARQGGHVILECQPALVRLMAGCVGVKQAIATGGQLPPHDFHTLVLSMPASFCTTLTTVPAERPYLGVDTQTMELWGHRLRQCRGLKIGLALDGESETGERDARLSVSPGLLHRLTRMPGVALIDVQQHGPDAADSAVPGVLPIGMLGAMPEDPSDAWVALAAVLRNLDLLITADNTIAQVAGAIGVPTWVALPLVPDFRWMLGRQDSPWYPTMRLFRQRVRGDWDEVVNRMVPVLEGQIAQRSREPDGAEESSSAAAG